MGQFSQRRRFGAIFEQARLELKNTREDDGAWSHVPRLRARFGQDYDVGAAHPKARIRVYQEVAFRQQRHRKAFDTVRGYIGYAFHSSALLESSIGFLVQTRLKSSGRELDTYFGPQLSLSYDAVRGRESPTSTPD